MSASKSKETKKRLDILNHSNDGFKIASEDLRLRGPGDLFGIRQSGLMNLNWEMSIRMRRSFRWQTRRQTSSQKKMKNGSGNCRIMRMRRKLCCNRIVYLVHSADMDGYSGKNINT